ncbi:MAG: T9SS type A sorting domain-containing protein [Bacteroidota bacterium]
MKKIVLLASACFFTLFTNAQINIDSTDLGNLDDSVLLSTAQSFTADFTSTGAGHSWDFSNLAPNSQFIKAYRNVSEGGTLANIVFGQFAAAKYKASYFARENNILFTLAGANLPVAIESFNRVCKINADSLTYIGIMLETGQGTFPIKSDTIESRFVFPMEYGQTHSTRGYTYADMNPAVNAIFIEHRKVESEVDGYGVLSSPYNDYQVLRVHHDIFQSDSIYADLQGTGTPTWAPIPSMHMHEYEWWAKNEKDPVLKITTQELFGFQVIQSIEYRDIFHPEVASVIENSIDFSLSPNPAQNNTLIKSDVTIEQINIVSAEGKNIRKIKEISAFEFSIDLSDIPAGVYFVEVISGSQSQKNMLVRN